MIDWTYTEDYRPPVRSDYRCFEATLPKRFHMRPCAPVLFSALGEKAIHAGFYFCDEPQFVSVLGRVYRLEIAYAWAPAPAPAPAMRPRSLANVFARSDEDVTALLDNVVIRTSAAALERRRA